MEKHPSQMDKRTREYKDWAAKQKEDAKAQEAPPAVVTTTSAVAATVIEEPTKKSERPAPTRPWERNGQTRPWRRNYFDLVKKHPGFRPRFVTPDKVEARIQRGYVVADPKDYGGLTDIDIRDSNGLGRHITRQGMVLMEIPEEGARAYEKQNEDFIRQQYKNIRDEVKKEAQEAGIPVDMESVGLR